jgi:E3 ubiquitin-protein ligase RNF19A
MKQISDLHYLSPSGCTFWGKKPWSRKKKILWQLGMLVGAPVGIALIAGIAVPAIVIGIPVWVGRKLHARLLKRENMARKNKNAIVATGVVASVCVSPILALVAVGIGIPILLAYVYGVVPISLCRSGGCGVDNSPLPVTRHAEIDEDEDMVTHNRTSAADELSVDTALSNRVNPSIGEMSLGMSTSVSMGSGSHLDRATCDRESASNAPLAGSITSATPSNRVEIHAEVSPRHNKRFSVSGSETASCAISLSDRLSHSCALDDGSVCACAGSISSRAAAAAPAAGSNGDHAVDESSSLKSDTTNQPLPQNHPSAETRSLSEVVVVPAASSPQSSSSLSALAKNQTLVENIRT